MDGFLQSRLSDRRFASAKVDVKRPTAATPWYLDSRGPPTHTSRLEFSKDSASCWKGYERVPGSKEFAEGSCRKKKEKKRRPKKSGSGSESVTSSESDGNGGRKKKAKVEKSEA